MENEPITILDAVLIYTVFSLLLSALAVIWRVMKFTAGQLRLFFSRDRS